MQLGLSNCQVYAGVSYILHVCIYQSLENDNELYYTVTFFIWDNSSIGMVMYNVAVPVCGGGCGLVALLYTKLQASDQSHALAKEGKDQPTQLHNGYPSKLGRTKATSMPT